MENVDSSSPLGSDELFSVECESAPFGVLVLRRLGKLDSWLETLRRLTRLLLVLRQHGRENTTITASTMSMKQPNLLEWK